MLKIPWERLAWTLVAGSSMTALAAGEADASEAVATFHSIGLSWAPSGGAATTAAHVRYRPTGTMTYKDGFPLWFDDRNGEYRGSLVELSPGTSYDIELSLEGTSTTESLTSTTWSNDVPIGNTVALPAGTSSAPLVLDAATYSGTASAYTLVTAAAGGTTIDVADRVDDCVVIQASYVVFRGVTIKGCSRNGIRLEGAHDVVIERNDVSGFGRILSDGWGIEGDAGVVCSKDLGVERIVIQRNHVHNPRADSNSWAEPRPAFGGNPHPAGTSAVYFDTCGGNNVIRYNRFDSDQDHYYEDVIGGAENYSDAGFPRADTDIYGNVIQNCWDDGIEAEGADKNVRIWGNYIDHTMVKIACAATDVGPLYIWRNIADVARTDDHTDPDTEDRGPFLKTGSDGTYGGGRMFVFHNTLLQPPNPDDPTGLPFGCGGGLTDPGGPMLDMFSRNNLLEIHKDWWASINDSNGSPTNDFDSDVFNGVVPPGSEADGHQGVPVYDASNAEGQYALDPASVGFDEGVVLPGFNDGFAGAAPDVGAFEAGSPPMQFGVDAYQDGSAPSGATSGSGAGASAASGGPVTTGGAAANGETSGADSGCACRHAPGSTAPGANSRVLGLLAALAVLSARRRRRAALR